MKRKISLLMIALLLALTACGKSRDSSVYGDTIAGLGDDELFEIVDIGADALVLLVTSQAYDDGNGHQAAISCDVYYYRENEVKNIGTLESPGTAYPISYDDSGLYTASGHEIQRYEIDDRDGSLVLAEAVYETFDENGNVSYTRTKGGNTEAVSEKDYMDLVEDYGKTRVVNFGYGATGRPLTDEGVFPY